MSDPPKFAVVQHNPTVGDVDGNMEQLIEGFERAAQNAADVVVTPELALLGYPPRDLLHRDAVLSAEEEAVDELREKTKKGPALIIGHTSETDTESGPPLHNTASVFVDGEERATYAKQLLPTYDVFDEHRYFSEGDGPTTVTVNGHEIGLTICEDGWHDHYVTGQQRHVDNPISDYAGVETLVNLSASPFYAGKPANRIERFHNHAVDTGAPVLFADQFGGNDDILFDGTSFIVSPSGNVQQAAFGESDILIQGKANGTDIPNEVKQLRSMISRGIQDYLHKTGFEEVVIGLSGGVDSSVTAALAAEALGPENVYGITLPSSVTSEENRSDAEALADNLNIEFGEYNISELASLFEGAGEHLTDGTLGTVTRENIQARARGVILMSVANDRDALVLTPDNKSEAAVGYCTLYGDTVGAIAPLGDCTKDRVYELAQDINHDSPNGAEENPIPSAVIDKKPTAELSEGQQDEDEIPPYEVIDAVVRSYVGEKKRLDEIADETGASIDQVNDVISRLVRSEFKREQTPPALRVTNKAFDSGWRYPIAAEYEALFDR